MKTREEVSVDGRDYLFSLSKMLPDGIKIVDIAGYVSKEFDTPVFAICKIVLSNGDSIFVDGEHDLAYLSDYTPEFDSLLESLVTDD